MAELCYNAILGMASSFFTPTASTPRGILLELMEARQVKPRDPWDVLGVKSATSEVLSGKRGISQAQAKALGEFFHVSPELFI